VQNFKWSGLIAAAIASATMGCGADEPSQSADGPSAPAPQGLSCAYPTASYGADEGMTVPDLSWSGLRPGASALESLNATEFIDCDGFKDINALVFLTHKPG